MLEPDVVGGLYLNGKAIFPFQGGYECSVPLWATVGGLLEFPCFIGFLVWYCVVGIISLGGGLIITPMIRGFASALVLFFLQLANNLSFSPTGVVQRITIVLGFVILTAWFYW